MDADASEKDCHRSGLRVPLPAIGHVTTGNRPQDPDRAGSWSASPVLPAHHWLGCRSGCRLQSGVAIDVGNGVIVDGDQHVVSGSLSGSAGPFIG